MVSDSRTRHEDIIRFAIRQQRFCTSWILDCTNNTNRNLNARRILDDLAGICIVFGWEIIGWMHLWTTCNVDTRTASNMDHINILLQKQNLLSSVFWQNTAFHFVVTIETQLNDKIIADDFTDGFQRHNWESATIFYRAAKFIGARVGDW